MIKWWGENKNILLQTLIILFVWRIITGLFIVLGKYFIRENPLFIGQITLANFDGVHYLNIAQNGYSFSQQAFFPLFPLFIKFLDLIIHNNLLSSIIIVYIGFFITIFLFLKLCLIDYQNDKAMWSLLLFLFFPTSFFLGNIYSESLFLALLLGSFYAARKKYWILAGILGGFASATRLVGIFILPALLLEWIMQNRKEDKKKVIRLFRDTIVAFSLIPIGIVSYMIYLSRQYGDALLFIHSQPNFGGNRSGGEIIFLPQVIVRYIKIFFSISPEKFVFWIALLEFFVFFGTLFTLFILRKRIRLSYLLFSILVIIFPSLTGTFSSEPRYVLAAFPLFMVLGNIKNDWIKIILLLTSFTLLSFLIMYYTRGYFVA